MDTTRIIHGGLANHLAAYWTQMASCRSVIGWFSNMLTSRTLISNAAFNTFFKNHISAGPERQSFPFRMNTSSLYIYTHTQRVTPNG